MDNNEDEDYSRFGLKIVFFLSLLLVGMDVLEIYFSYYSLKDYSKTLAPIIFTHCVKYPIITQMFFTTFATLAGLSACFMSLGLLIDYQFFALKLLDSFMFYNFYSFGPFLLGCSILAFCNFGKVCYSCDNDNYSVQYLNISTVICIIIAFTISLMVTFGYSVISAFEYFNNSIKFNRDGNYVLGKLFWKYVFGRAIQDLNRSDILDRENREFELNRPINEDE